MLDRGQLDSVVDRMTAAGRETALLMGDNWTDRRQLDSVAGRVTTGLETARRETAEHSCWTGDSCAQSVKYWEIPWKQSWIGCTVGELLGGTAGAMLDELRRR